MFRTNSLQNKTFASYEDFVREVYATREEVIAWDKVATKVDSFVGYSIPGFNASFEAIMNQYAFLIRCIEGERTMDEAMTELIRQSWEGNHERAIEEGMAGHPFFKLMTEVKDEAIATNMLFGQDGRERERQIAFATENLKINYYPVADQSEESFAIDGILLELDPFLHAVHWEKRRYKSFRSFQIFNFPSRYRDALDDNPQLEERMDNIGEYIFREESKGTPVSLFYEHLDDYGKAVSAGV